MKGLTTTFGSWKESFLYSKTFLQDLITWMMLTLSWIPMSLLYLWESTRSQIQGGNVLIERRVLRELTLNLFHQMIIIIERYFFNAISMKLLIWRLCTNTWMFRYVFHCYWSRLWICLWSSQSARTLALPGASSLSLREITHKRIKQQDLLAFSKKMWQIYVYTVS